MDENYAALIVAIIKCVPPEQAFKFLNGDFTRPSLTTEDDEDMFRFKEQGLVYKDIGEIYGISAQAVYLRIKRRKGVVV